MMRSHFNLKFSHPKYTQLCFISCKIQCQTALQSASNTKNGTESYKCYNVNKTASYLISLKVASSLFRHRSRVTAHNGFPRQQQYVDYIKMNFFYFCVLHFALHSHIRKYQHFSKCILCSFSYLIKLDAHLLHYTKQAYRVFLVFC